MHSLARSWARQCQKQPCGLLLPQKWPWPSSRLSHTWKHCRAVGQELAHVGTMSRLDTLRWMTMSNLHCWQRLQDVQSSGKLLGLRACQLLADSGRIPQSLSWISWPVSAVHTWASSCASQIGIAWRLPDNLIYLFADWDAAAFDEELQKQRQQLKSHLKRGIQCAKLPTSLDPLWSLSIFPGWMCYQVCL